MATEPNQLRRDTIRRLRQELVADVELANNLLHELNRYLEQLRTRAPEMLKVEALPDDPLIKYGFSALERASNSDMTNSANMVPMKVLQRMESIRSRFFSGVDLNSKKSIWVKWSKVLCSKEKGGLGVSSLYALNRALMYKWVWRFTTQKNLLWTRVIKAIHGEDGKNGSGFKVGYKFIWRSILQEVETLKIKGIHLNNFMQKKLGNGADTYFWEDLWHGDMVLKQRYPRLYALEVKKTVDVASKLSQENLTWSFRRAPRSGVEQDQLTDLTTYVEGVVLGVTPNRWHWTLDGLGEFSVASTRKVIDDNRFPEVSTQTRW
ncbi:hypothetical protein Tco_1230926, partial [Tanacetum coccineum]